MKLVLSALICVFVLLSLGHMAAAQETHACTDGERRVCGIDIGICEPGRSVCKEGNWSECEGMVEPEESETCGNSLDDDCDGAVDENCFPWISLILVGTGILFICIGMIYMEKEKGERMLSEGVGKD